MVFPFSRRHQERMARQLLEHLKSDPPLIVHVVTFPVIWINHSLVVYEAKPTESQILFTIYDPYNPSKPAILTYDRVARSFSFPANDYWPGGKLDVYEIYHKWDY